MSSPYVRVGPANIRCRSEKCGGETRVVTSHGDDESVTRVRECKVCERRFVTREAEDGRAA
jgi:transcriptional regulator NrdR family protein